MTARPSFLVFATDRHRSNHTDSGGDSVVRTPRLDRLTARRDALVLAPARAQMQAADTSPKPTFLA